MQSAYHNNFVHVCIISSVAPKLTHTSLRKILSSTLFGLICATFNFQVEGVAYRGRVMVGVEMSLGTLPNTRNEDISSNDLERFAPFLRRRKYKLFGVLFSATRVYPGNHPVQFELSIGNYGNKQDDNSPTQSSTTSPSNPIYDGNKYYYLPWEGRKPVLLVRL